MLKYKLQSHLFNYSICAFACIHSYAMLMISCLSLVLVFLQLLPDAVPVAKSCTGLHVVHVKDAKSLGVVLDVLETLCYSVPRIPVSALKLLAPMTDILNLLIGPDVPLLCKAVVRVLGPPVSSLEGSAEAANALLEAQRVDSVVRSLRRSLQHQ